MTAIVKSAVGKKEGGFIGKKKKEKEMKKGREEEYLQIARLQGWLSRTMTISFYFSQPRLAHSGFRLLFILSFLPFLQSSEFTPHLSRELPPNTPFTARTQRCT